MHLRQLVPTACDPPGWLKTFLQSPKRMCTGHATTLRHLIPAEWNIREDLFPLRRVNRLRRRRGNNPRCQIHCRIRTHIFFRLTPSPAVGCTRLGTIWRRTLGPLAGPVTIADLLSTVHWMGETFFLHLIFHLARYRLILTTRVLPVL